MTETGYFRAIIDKKDEQIEQLEKENSNLRGILKNSGVCLPGCSTKRELTQAKDIIKEFMRISIASVEEYEPEFSELIEKAECFTKGE